MDLAQRRAKHTGNMKLLYQEEEHFDGSVALEDLSFGLDYSGSFTISISERQQKNSRKSTYQSENWSP
jgi:hypothetical protein